MSAPAPAAVRVSGLTKSFGSTRVLDGIDLVARRGEVTCIIGPSGSGKSTLLRCIAFLEEATGGLIEIDGQPLGYALGPSGERMRLPTAAIRSVRSHIGMVFQQFNLFPHLTAGQNVMLAPKVVTNKGPRDGREEAEQHLARVGLAEKFDSYPSQLSGGQQQRVAIARALAMQPKVLLCDEITSALDPELVNEVLHVVEGLARDGMTLILVTHEMRFARDVGTKLVFMHQGRVHEAGPPKELFARPGTPELAQFVASIHS